jgi:peptidoglycan hydrolase CwlO-like protein
MKNNVIERLLIVVFFVSFMIVINKLSNEEKRTEQLQTKIGELENKISILEKDVQMYEDEIMYYSNEVDTLLEYE